MKKWAILLAMALCLALALPCALAEEAYVPGQRGQQLISEAWNSGKLIEGNMAIQLDLNPQALGITDADEIAQIEAIETLLNALTLSGGAVKLDDGVRIQLAGTLSMEEKTPVSVDAALEFTYDGLSIESSLIPGEKVSATWETLLALSGLEPSEIEMILSLRDVDLAQALSQLETQLEAVLAEASGLLEPYANTVTTWAAGLDIEQSENVPADEDYPATALLVDIYITPKDLGDLLTALANQLSEDEALIPYVDTALAQYFADTVDQEGNPLPAPTTQELCEEIIEGAQTLTDTDSLLLLTLGFDEAGTPLYIEFFTTEDDGTNDYLGLFLYPGDEPNTTVYDFTMFTSDADYNIIDALSVFGTYAGDPADPLSNDFELDFVCIESGELIGSLNYTLSSASSTTSDGLPGGKTSGTMTLSIEDDELVQMIMSMNTTYAQTADGGDSSDVTSTLDMYIGDQSINYTVLVSALIAPAENGFSFIESMTEMAPAIGIERYGIDLTGASTDYIAPVGLTETALESVSTEQMDALMQRLSDNATMLVFQIMNAVPEETLNLLLDAME